VAEGPSDLICNQVTLHRRDLLDASSSSIVRQKFAFFSSKNAVFLLP
jgi:hypothetical protein